MKNGGKFRYIQLNPGNQVNSRQGETEDLPSRTAEICTAI